LEISLQLFDILKPTTFFHVWGRIFGNFTAAF